MAAQQFGVVDQRALRPLDRLFRELSGGIDTLTQSHDAHLAVDVAQLPVDRIGDQQPDRIRPAVDCTHCAHVQTFPSRIPTMPGSAASSANASSPNGFTPGPFASECAITTCRHLTRSGMPPPENVVPSDSIASRSSRYDSCALRYAAASCGSCCRRSVISRIRPDDSSRLAAAVNTGWVR